MLSTRLFRGMLIEILSGFYSKQNKIIFSKIKYNRQISFIDFETNAKMIYL